MNTLPFPKDASGVPYYNNKDASDNLAMPVEQVLRDSVGNFAATAGTMTYTHSVANVGTTSSQVLAANANRRYALLINDSSMPIYVKVGAAAAMSQGIRLEADGGNHAMVWGKNLSVDAIYAITETGTGVLLVTEGA